MAWLTTKVIENHRVALLPLAIEHKDALIAAASDGDLWELWFTSVPNKDSIDTYIEKALTQQINDTAMAFAVFDKTHQKIVGSTRICNAVAEHKRVEIGYTWYAKSCQRTDLNSQCKLLLLDFAFEELDCIAVEFRTHWHNTASRTAIARLGAKQDGVLRSHQIAANGTVRDTVVFSILKHEWPAAKVALESKMKRHASNL